MVLLEIYRKNVEKHLFVRVPDEEAEQFITTWQSCIRKGEAHFTTISVGNLTCVADVIEGIKSEHYGE